MLYDVDFSFLVIPGTVTVFLATYLYMVSAPPKALEPAQPVLKEVEQPMENQNLIRRIYYAFSPKGPLRSIGLAATTTGVFILLAAVTFYRIQLNHDQSEHGTTAADHVNSISESIMTNGTFQVMPIPEVIAKPKPTIFESPFKNTIASIRINHDLPERITTLREGYEPFFHTVHISMPHRDEDPKQTNFTRDFWDNSETPYPPIVETVQYLIEQADDEVEGLLWYHFDSWIEPLSFGNMDFEKFWVLDTRDPPTQCVKDEKMLEGWSWVSWGKHNAVREASHAITELYPEYKFDPQEFCSGWSDMYYIPRKYFADFVKLGRVFADYNAYHEIAIPTLFHIIDQTYRKHPSLSILYKWADCWGDCCTSNPRKFDVGGSGAWICGYSADRCVRCFASAAAISSITSIRMLRIHSMIGWPLMLCCSVRRCPPTEKSQAPKIPKYPTTWRGSERSDISVSFVKE